MKHKKMKIITTPEFEKSFIKLFSNNPIYAIPRWFDNMKSEIEWAFQRVFRGFDDRWYWDLNSKLSWIIPKCVRHIKKYGMGCPQILYDDKKKNNCHKWGRILEEIAKGFEASDIITNEYLYKGKRYEKLKAQKDKGMRLFIKWFGNLWD